MFCGSELVAISVLYYRAFVQSSVAFHRGAQISKSLIVSSVGAGQNRLGVGRRRRGRFVFFLIGAFGGGGVVVEKILLCCRGGVVSIMFSKL